MKKMRKLIPAFAMLMVAAIMMTTASFAWFSIGTTASVNGMSVQAKSDSSMIIHEDANFREADDTATMTASGTALLPVTYNNGWKAPANPSTDVNVQTGALKPNVELADVEPDGYVETYEMYLASASDAIEGDLVITFAGLTNLPYLHNALSIQVLVYTATAGAETAFAFNDPNTVTVKDFGTKNTVTVAGLTVPCAYAENADEGTLDYNTASGNYVKVVFNVYFDGAMLDSQNNYYVQNVTMDTTGVNFTASFEMTNLNTGA